MLFERDRTVIQRHIRNIYNEGELTRDTTCAKFAHVGKDGDQTYVRELFNLDVIISVGYRVKSKRGTQFRIWANAILKDYLIKGYAVKSDLVQQKYDDLKALVDVMGRTMGYLDSPVDEQIRSIFDVVQDSGRPLRRNLRGWFWLVETKKLLLVSHVGCMHFPASRLHFIQDQQRCHFRIQDSSATENHCGNNDNTSGKSGKDYPGEVV